MKKLSINQRKALAEFCGNFAVAWLAAGIVPTIITGKINSEAIKTAISAILASGVLLTILLYLTRGRK